MAVTTTKDEQVALGPCDITYDGLNLGHVKDVKVKFKFHELKGTVAKYGQTTVNKWHLATEASIEITPSQTNGQLMEKMMQAMTRYASGSDEAVGIGKIAGALVTPLEMIITPTNTAQSYATKYPSKFWKVTPMDGGEPGISYSAEVN